MSLIFLASARSRAASRSRSSTCVTPAGCLRNLPDFSKSLMTPSDIETAFQHKGAFFEDCIEKSPRLFLFLLKLFFRVRGEIDLPPEFYFQAANLADEFIPGELADNDQIDVGGRVLLSPGAGSINERAADPRIIV